MLKSTFGEIAMKSRQRQKDILFSLIVFFSAFAVNLLIQKLFTTQTLVPMIFVFGVFLISLKTHGYCYGITSAIVSVFAVDFAFTYPYYVFGFFVEESILSAVIMMVVAVSTSTLNIRIRDQEKLRSENEKERMRGNLLRAISHDLRTPLTSIYGSSSTLISKYDALPKEQQLKLLGEIQEDSEWLIRMVENLLSVTRIDGAKVEVVKTPTVLDELIDSVLMKFSKKHPNQKVITQIPEEFVDIPMDPLLIEQVLLNLLENAVFHAKGMTELTLSVSLVGDKAVFEVADNGCGIPAGELETAFLRHALLDPFNAERLDGPLPGRERLFAEVPHFFGLVETAPFGHHVFGHEFRRVFEAFFFLHGCSRNAHDAAVDDGIAPDDAHLLQYADRSAGQPSFNSGGKTGKSGTNDDNIERFIPLFGHRIKSFGRCR